MGNIAKAGVDNDSGEGRRPRGGVRFDRRWQARAVSQKGLLFIKVVSKSSSASILAL